MTNENILEEILKQEIVIKKINDTLLNLNNEKEFINNNSFSNMLFGENNGEKAVDLFLLCAAMVLLVNIFGLSNIMTYIIVSLSLTVCIPSLIIQYKKYKKDNMLKLANIEEQIKEFKDKLEKENGRLNTLKNEKNINDEKLDKLTINIDNDMIDKLSKIENRKKIYEYYRKNCVLIKKAIDKGVFNDSLFSNEEIENLKVMSEHANKVLAKKKDKKNK